MEFTDLIIFLCGLFAHPLVDRWNKRFKDKDSKKLFFSEAEDYCEHLKDIIHSHFDFYLEIISSDKVEKETIPPIPTVGVYELTHIDLTYSKCFHLFNINQRRLVRKINEINSTFAIEAETFQKKLEGEFFINRTNIANIVTQAGWLYYHLYRFCTEKTRYCDTNSLDSINSTKHVLKVLGYPKDQIEVLNFLKSSKIVSNENTLNGNTSYKVL